MRVEAYEWDQYPYKRSSRESPCPFQHVRMRQEGAGYEPGRGPLPSDTGTLVLDFPAFGAARNKCLLLFISLAGCGTVMAVGVD